MSVIILPSKWTRQPPGHAELDHSNYFGNLAVAAFLPGEPSPWAGTYGREPRPQGVFASFNGSTNGTVVQKSINAYPFSYVAQAYVSNLTDTNTIIGMGSDTANTYALLDLSGTEADDPFRLIIGAGATNSKIYKFSSSGHTSVVRTFVCVFESATVFRLYIDGAEVSNTAIAGNGLQGLANLTHFGVGSYKSDAGDYTNKLTGGASVGAMFPVGFDASMAREISRNPWQMFRRVPQVLYFNAGGGATITPTGLSSSAFGSFSVNAGDRIISFTGKASEEAFGAFSLRAKRLVSFTGKNSDEAFGAFSIHPGKVSILLNSKTTDEAYGTHSLLSGQKLISPTAKGSDSAFGSFIIVSGDRILLINGAASNEAFGAFSVNNNTATQTVIPSGYFDSSIGSFSLRPDQYITFSGKEYLEFGQFLLSGSAVVRAMHFFDWIAQQPGLRGSLNDKLYQYLIAQGFTGSTPTMMFLWLRSLGYTGNTASMLTAFERDYTSRWH